MPDLYIQCNVMDPRHLLAEPEILKRIEAACQRRFPYPAEADECFVFVIEGLKADDFARLRKFKGNSKPTTYLYAVTNSLIYDFQRKRYGRKRIPKVVERLGAWAEAVYRLICWQSYSLEEAFDTVSLQGVYTGTYEEFLGEAIPVRDAPCQANPRFESVEQRAEAGHEQTDPQANPLEALLAKLDHQRRLRAAEVIRQLTAQLSQEDQLLLKLVYASDQSVAAAGRVVGMNANQAHKRLKAILLKLRTELLKIGVREA